MVTFPPEAKNILPLQIYLKQGVESFIFNGADLMWPGIYSINLDQDEDADKANEDFKMG